MTLPISVDVAQYVFYILLTAIAGLGEYFHLVPTGTMIAVLGLVTGHFFGNGATKSVLTGIAGSVNKISDAVTPTPAPTLPKEDTTLHA